MNSWLRSSRLLLPAAARLLRPPQHNISRLHAIRGHLFRRPSTVVLVPQDYSTSLRKHVTGHLAPCGYSHAPHKVAAALTSRSSTNINVNRGFHVHVDTVPYINRRHVVICSRREACEWGDDYFEELKTKHASEIVDPLNRDSIRVREIGLKIIHAIHSSSNRIARGGLLPSQIIKSMEWVDELNWEMIVVEDEDIFRVSSHAGGKIVVSTGFLKHFNTDTEIAVVLGHEVAHVVARHTVELIRIFMAFNKFPTHLLATPFLRRNEREADYIGMLLLAAAGFDPHAAPIFYEKFGKIAGENALLRMLTFISCRVHPSSKKRSWLLSQPKVMEEAMALYREAISDDGQGYDKDDLGSSP